MKKIFSILCALLLLAGAQAAVFSTQTNPTEVNCSRCIHSVFPYYVWYVLTAEDQSQVFYFAIMAGEGKTDVETGKQYTLADMIGEDSEWDDAERNSHSYAEATFVKTVSAAGKMLIEASVTDVDGVSFHVVYDESKQPEIPSGGEYTITNVGNSFFPTDNDVFYALNDTVNHCSFYFDIIVASGTTDVESGRTYTIDDMIALSSYAEISGYLIPFASASFTKTVAADYSYQIEAEAVDTAGNTWTLHYSSPVPRVRNLTIKADSLTINQNARSWHISGYNADSSLFISLYSITENLVGHFNVTSFQAFNTYVVVSGNDTVIYDVKAADITITSPSEGMYVLSGTLGTANMNDPQDLAFFTLDCKAFPPAPYVFPATLTGSGYELELMGGQWLIEGTSDEGLYFSFNGLTSKVAGHYDASLLDNYYTYVTPDGQTYYDLAEADIEVAYADHVATLTGSITVANESDPSDAHTLAVSLTARYVVPTERHYDGDSEQALNAVFEVYMTNDEYMDQYHALLVESINENRQTIQLLFYLPRNTNSLAPGTYPVSASQSPQTVAASAGLTDMGGITYSFIGSFDARGSFAAPYWFIVDGSVVVAEDGSIVVDAFNSFGQSVYCVLAGIQQAIENVQSDKVQCAKVLRDGQLYLMYNGTMYNVQGNVVK